MNHQDVTSDLRQFAGNLVDGVIKTVSETKSDYLSYDATENDEITISDTSLKNDISVETFEKNT